jgi:hypothetical protein
MPRGGYQVARGFKTVEQAPALVIPEVSIREVVGFPGYRVGDDGSVWSWHRGLRWQKLKPWKINRGYLVICLCDDSGQHIKQVHSLVLTAFVGPRPDGMMACHFPDRDKGNNALSNLRWGTQTENMADAKVHGTWTHGERQAKAKLRRSDIQGIRDRCASGESTRSVARSFGVHCSVISRVVTGEAWKHA